MVFEARIATIDQGKGDKEHLMLWQPLYDLQVMPAATAAFTRNYFQVVNTGFLTTNLLAAGQIPYGRNFFAHGLAGVPDPDVDWQDLNTLLKSAYVKLRIGKEDVLELPLKMLPSACGVSGAAATTDTTTTIARPTIGVPHPSAYFPIRWRGTPYPIEGGETFKAEIVFLHASETITTAFGYQLFLMGERAVS